jgi:hypothetical protein
VCFGTQTFQARKVSHSACTVLTPRRRKPEGTPISFLNSVSASPRVKPAHTFGREDGGGGGGMDTVTGVQLAVVQGGTAPGAAHALWPTASPATADTSSSSQARTTMTRLLVTPGASKGNLGIAVPEAYDVVSVDRRRVRKRANRVAVQSGATGILGSAMAALGPPDGVEQVRLAFRLGWAVAELRGRYRPDRFEQPVPADGTPKFDRPEHELPLSVERSPYEVRIEVIEVAEGLSGALNLDPTLLASVRDQLDKMNAHGADRDRVWPGLADAFFRWDAATQDALALRALQAAAYQLGRGLAETYWALYPDRPETQMGSWTFLFGSSRCGAIHRSAARLSSFLGPLVIAAIDGPLVAWASFATSDSRDDDEALPLLYTQGLLWRDLIRGERLPQDLNNDPSVPTAKDQELWRDLRLYWNAVDTLKWPLLTAAIGTIALVAGAALLASGAPHTGLATAVGLLGAVGLTSAGLYARAKAKIVSLFATLRQAVDMERVRRAANLCPPAPRAQ